MRFKKWLCLTLEESEDIWIKGFADYPGKATRGSLLHFK